MSSASFDRLDRCDRVVRKRLLRHCRLRAGEWWLDPVCGHAVGCGDAADPVFLSTAPEAASPILAIHDPPYNLVAFARRSVDDYVAWCRRWVDLTAASLTSDASMYVWLGADQKRHYQPLPQFMVMMADTPFDSRSFITMRNQRGYGTRANWMAVRQELLYYTIGRPEFTVQYTDIPKILRGYYKEVAGNRTENLERSHSDTIRPGNVWVDIQQVFYRLGENVNGCFAQKPLRAVERIVAASSCEGDTVIDWFAHAGTTLLACERLGRRCVTCDIDPVFAEVTIRRLECYRTSGRLGWQRGHPFEHEPGTRRDRAAGEARVASEGP